MIKAYDLKLNKNSLVNVGIFTSKQEAVQAMERAISEANQGLNPDDEDYLTPFDFTLDEIESKEINEVITTYEEARDYLVGKPNADFSAAKNMLSDSQRNPEDVTQLVKEVNPKHIKAIVAFNRLCTIAQAWNKADGFEPDFSNASQYKYFPWFVYDNGAAGFVFALTNYAATYAYAHIGSRLCFKTRERAMQFGKQFIDLWNEVLLFKRIDYYES